MGYRLKIMIKHPKGWIEGERIINKEFDLISDAITELNNLVGHLVKYGEVIAIHIEKEK